MNQILVVDDHDEFRSIVNDLLHVLQPNATILNASNGADGLTVAQSNHPDLILTDLQMPVMDGYELAMALRQDAALQNVPLLIMTSARDAGPTLIRLNQVCHGVLKKPFSLDDLETVLKQCCNETISGE
ncbi:MAG: response regulator [Anaerolineales bacterium]|nr:response regulator [Anaerolineales bacterium]MCB8968508.1 response regulator [Ardenticatenaceae bacterium]